MNDIYESGPGEKRPERRTGKPLSAHAAESGNDEIARVFKTVLGKR
jgi:hypothetical protein